MLGEERKIKIDRRNMNSPRRDRRRRRTEKRCRVKIKLGDMGGKTNTNGRDNTAIKMKKIREGRGSNKIKTRMVGD